MGHNVISYGMYHHPDVSGILRPNIANLFFDDSLRSAVMQSSKDNIHDNLIEWADAIIVMHKHEWIENNWSRIAQKRVIWRSIGQSIPDIELVLAKYKAKGLQLVRYSPYEERIKNYAGHDAVIRFYKDPEEYRDWTGHVPEIMSIAQAMPHKGRERELNWKAFRLASKGLPTTLYGFGNEEAGEMNGGGVTYDELKLMLRAHRGYLYTGTMPACYTLGFIEALMTGIPVVAIGNLLGYDSFYKQNTYEVADILSSGLNGFASNDTQKLNQYLDALIKSEKLARKISQKGRELAIRFFGKPIITKQWSDFL